MHVYLILLLGVIALFTTSNAVSASKVKLQTSHSFIQSTDRSETTLNSQRLLRTEAKTDGTFEADNEERAALDIFKKLGTSTKKWLQDKALILKLGSYATRATPSKVEGLATKLVTDGVDPNRAYKVLNLHQPKNVYVGDGVDKTGEFLLWEKMKEIKQNVSPGWTSNY